MTRACRDCKFIRIHPGADFKYWAQGKGCRRYLEALCRKHDTEVPLDSFCSDWEAWKRRRWWQ